MNNILSVDKYPYATQPFAHQQKIFEDTAERSGYALFWEQGCGKTKPIIDTCAYLYMKRQEINAMLVVAPNGVERNWVSDEIPKHLPKQVKDMTYTMLWQTAKSRTKWHENMFRAIIIHPGLSILCISYHAFMTPRGKKAVWEFLKKRNVLYVLDESDDIKTPKAKRTQSIIASGKYAQYRRILTGTPVDKPFDIYSQIRFIGPDIWKERGLPNFRTFKQHYGVWFTDEDCKRELGYSPGYDQLVEYKNLKELAEIVDRYGDRLLKTDVFDLPEKLYSKRYFEMTKKQQSYYNELRDKLLIELEEGEIVDGTLAITRLLRLQQIVCGYMVTDGEEPFVMCDDKNPRLNCAVEFLEKLNHSAIIWCRFRHDVDQLMEALGESACRYDGAMTDEECAQSKIAFLKGEKQFLVGNIAKGSRGLTLNIAKTTIYYSNTFRLRDRLQSEDRNHRWGQEGAEHAGEGHGVLYMDIIAQDTVDDKIVASLRDKRNIASLLTGDTLKKWI